MANFLTGIVNERGTRVTRLGHHRVAASVQSWFGSVVVILWTGPDGELLVSINWGDGSTASPCRVLWEGRLTELANPDTRLEVKR